MNTLMSILAAGIDPKTVLMTCFILVVIGIGAWMVQKWAIPQPFNWLIYFVLAVAAVFTVYRFIQDV